MYAAIHYRGQRYRVYTSEKVITAFFTDGKCKEGKIYPDGEIINRRLDLWRKTISKAIDSFERINPPTQVELTTRIMEIRDAGSEKNLYLTAWIESFIPASGRSESTRKRYKTSLNILKEYESSNRLRFKDIDLTFYKKLKVWMDDKGYSLNFFGSVVKHIKTFMNESEHTVHHGITDHLNVKFATLSETADSIYLTMEELERISKLEITDESVRKAFPKMAGENISRRVASFRVIRDRFLIGCFTALRVSDFSRLSPVNISDRFIRIKPVKGGLKNQDVVIPIHPVIKEILARGFDWDKKVYDQKINVAIKHICRMAKITEKVSVSRTEGGKVITRTFDKCELVTTHTARRSGATNMFKAGIPSLSIMLITGHRTERSFLKYIKISAEENAEILSKHPFFKDK